MSPEEKQAKMMAFLTKDPAVAGKQMQEMATSGAKQLEIQTGLDRKRQALSAQWEAAEAQYTSETAPLGPLLRTAMVQSEPGGNPALARQAATQYDALYQKLCAKWLVSEASPAVKYLRDFKRFLTQDQTAALQEIERYAKFQFDLYGVGSASYRSTAPAKAVIEYVDAMVRVFGRRRVRPESK